MSAKRLLARYLLPHWRLLLVLALLLAATIGLRLLNPQIVRAFLDSATSDGSQQELLLIAAIFLGSAFLLQATAVAEVWAAESLGMTTTNSLRADLALHVLRLDPEFHGQHTPGDLIERTDGDVATLANFFSRLVIYVVGHGLLLAGVLILLAAIDLRIGAAALAFTALGAALISALRRVAVSRFQRLRQANAELYGLIEERLGGTEDVRANGGVAYVMRRLLERCRDLVWAEVGAGWRAVGSSNQPISRSAWPRRPYWPSAPGSTPAARCRSAPCT